MMTQTDKPPIRLLLIEDSPTDARLFRALIGDVKDVDFSIEHRDTLGAGLSLLESDDFDAIVLDLNLPDSTGLATFDSVRGVSDPLLAVVILTGNDDRTAVNLALEKGADNYLLKDSADGNRIAISILSAIRNRSSGVHAFGSRSKPKKAGS